MAKSSPLPTRNRQPIGRLTDAGLWAYSYGEPPHVVTLRENRRPGAPLVWDYAGNRARAIGERIVVRTPDGKGGWTWDVEAVARAEKKAQERSAQRLLDVPAEDLFAQAVRSELAELEGWLRAVVTPAGALRLKPEMDRVAQRIAALPRGKAAGIITVEEGFALYHAPETGGLPASRSGRQQHVRARAVWTAALRDPRTGASMPWNDVTLAHVEAVAFRLRAAGKVVTGEKMVTCLTTVYNHLRKKLRMRDLESPTEGFDFEAYLDGYEPNQPRYTPEEIAALMRVRDQVDPRFALLLGLARYSGDRKAAYIRTWRSALNGKLAKEPDPKKAPHGWLKLPRMKGGRAPLLYLTSRQRAELDRAFAGVLADLEREFQASGRDYPLFPAAMIREPVRHRAIRVDAPGAYRPVGDQLPEMWLKEAERLAGVEHQHGRGWHAFRRVVKHRQAELIGKEKTADAAGWKGTKMLDEIYMEDERHEAAAAVREAMEDDGLLAGPGHDWDEYEAMESEG